MIIKMDNMCMHCLEEGDWEDEDKCPTCAKKGHVSPWVVSGCPACNKEYDDRMDVLLKRIGLRNKETVKCDKCNGSGYIKKEAI